MKSEKLQNISCLIEINDETRSSFTKKILFFTKIWKENKIDCWEELKKKIIRLPMLERVCAWRLQKEYKIIGEYYRIQIKIRWLVIVSVK